MRPDVAALVRQIRDGTHERGFGGIRSDVEHVDQVTLQSTRPQVAAIVGKSHVMRLAAAAYRNRIHHFAIGLGVRIDTDGDQFVRTVSHAFYAKRPHVYELFLALDQLAHVRRVARFVGARRGGDERPRR